MMYVLDTTIVSELRKVRAGEANPGIADWVSGVPSGQSTSHGGDHAQRDFERFDELDVRNPWR